MFKFLLLFASLLLTSAGTTTFPTSINIYVISPISNYDYAANSPFPLSFGIENAFVAEFFSFSLIYSIKGYAASYQSSTPIDLDTGSLFSNTISPNSSTYIWNTTPSFTEAGNWTLEWDFQMSSCVVYATETDYTIEGTVASGKVDFTVSANGGPANVRSCSTVGGSVVIASNSTRCAQLGNSTSSAIQSVCTTTVSIASTSSSVASSTSVSSGTIGTSPTTTSTGTTSSSTSATSSAASSSPSKSSGKKEIVSGGVLGLVGVALCIMLV